MILSNKKISNEIKLFYETCNSVKFKSKPLQNLSLFEWKQNDVYSLSSCLFKKFRSLKSLHIHESTTVKESNKYMTSHILSDLQQLIFEKPSKNLEELTLILNDGMLVTKQLHSNLYLKYLTISLINLHDLYILLDGLVPNLIYLKAIICQHNVNQRMSLHKSLSSKFFMANLDEFILDTNENVTLTLEQLHAIFKPLQQLTTLTLNIKKFINETQMNLINIEQYLPKLKHFSCSIYTISNINKLVCQHWPMIMCHNNNNDSKKHFYTITNSFEQIYLSMISLNETQNIQHLIVDTPSVITAHCFTNLHTLTIAIDDGDFSNYTSKQFPALRHLIIKRINMISPSILRRISTLTLSTIDDLFNHSQIYSNIRYLTIKESSFGSSEQLIRFLNYFPNLHSIEITLESNDLYFANLDILINHEYLPYLACLRTNWMEQSYTSLPTIQLEISSNTSLKWNQTGYHIDYTFDADSHKLIISL